ncbi:MAG: hypothetical protein IT335_06505 [Thermomicrobiales bacterium]|nr:hypothetical protein [Thermomicrobiales bacterium]
MQSDDPEQSHCQPCYFNYSACCFDDFCANVATNCCVTDDDCPPPECDLYQENVIRYECVAYTASGGVCEPVIDQTCDGCTSCLDTDNGPICQAGCLPEYACCDGDFCQPIRTCPADCLDDDDCPGDCAFCQENGYCCDRACCPAGSVCLTSQYPDSDDEGCCPAESICGGSGAFADRAVCCGGDTPECCVREDGEPVCINPETQCCLDDECPSYPQICEIGICLRETQTCDLAWACEENEQSCCPNFEEGQVGICLDDDQCCDSGECWRLTDYPACIIGVCNLETRHCETASACDLGQGCCAEGLDGACAPVADATTCDLEFGGEGICCSGECADTSLCVCSRDVECDPDRCEVCFRGRCTNRCDYEFPNGTCDGAGTCVECVEQGDCMMLPFCNTETQTCYACQDDDFCLECQMCDQETGSCVPDPSLHGTACEIPGEGPGLSCCFGDCVASCERCSSDDDCAGCETCALSDDPEQSHCQPCYFEFNGCCFGDFCANIGTNCCVTDDDCPPPECDFEQENVIRYECVPYAASGGVCEPVIDQTCDGCASCQDTDSGPTCQAGCLPGRACCEGDFCQPIRTCPPACMDATDCPGACDFCNSAGFCATDESCETAFAPVETVSGSEDEVACEPLLGCAPEQCGLIADGCGGEIDCGPCPSTT